MRWLLLLAMCCIMAAAIDVDEKDEDEMPSPLVYHLYFDSYKQIYFDKLESSIFLLISKTSSEYEKLKNDFIAAAKEFVGRTRYVIVDMDDQWNRQYVDSTFGHKEKPVPTIYATVFTADGPKRRFWADITEITAENIAIYNRRILAGHLVKQIFRSDEIPEDWDALPVKVLVGKNFHEVVKNSGKSALVFFYSPYSPYSTRLYDVWEEIGDMFGNSENILVAKVDAVHDKNEIEGLHIPGLPSIMYFPAGSEEVVQYNGEKTLDGIVNFVKDQVKREENSHGEL